MLPVPAPATDEEGTGTAITRDPSKLGERLSKDKESGLIFGRAVATPEAEVEAEAEEEQVFTANRMTSSDSGRALSRMSTTWLFGPLMVGKIVSALLTNET